MNPYLWLILGAVLSAGYHGRWTIAAPAWLALTALLHFTRQQQPVAGLLWTWLGGGAAPAVRAMRRVRVESVAPLCSPA